MDGHRILASLSQTMGAFVAAQHLLQHEVVLCSFSSRTMMARPSVPPAPRSMLHRSVLASSVGQETSV